MLSHAQYVTLESSKHTLADLGSGISARGAGVLLDVEGATTYCVFCQSLDFNGASSVPVSISMNIRHTGEKIDVPQRLQSVCVLLWRLPKLEVPFAVDGQFSRTQSRRRRSGVRRTHSGLGTAASIVSVYVESM
jgi:hypothetical protein